MHFVSKSLLLDQEKASFQQGNAKCNYVEVPKVRLTCGTTILVNKLSLVEKD